MKNILLKSFFITAVFAFGGCTKDFDGINTNPNAPISVAPNLLLPGVQRDMANAVMNESWGIGNIVIQQTAKNQFVNEDRYLWGEINGIWNTGYTSMRNVNNILQIAQENGQKEYEAVALIMKSWIFSLITDAYGDCPYSEATQGNVGIYYPKYDNQEDIYNGILADLSKANDIIATNNTKIQGDNIYGGDMSKWRKLANSLRIRALMRISKKRNVGGDISTIINDPAKFPIFASNDDLAAYSYGASNPDQFPLYSARSGSFNEFRASETLVNYLKSISDPRINVFFNPTPASAGTANPVITGIPNGLDDVTAQTFAGGQQNHSTIGDLYYQGSINASGLKIAKGIIMTYAELQFLLAEAAEKSLITGDAAQYYKQGIEASYAYYSLVTPAGYFDQADVKFAGTSDEKLRKIGMQKWVALFYTGLEAWFDWRRTGIPTLTPAVSNQNNNKIPVRFIYPIIEQALNGPNRQEAFTRQGGDDINTKMWIIQ